MHVTCETITLYAKNETKKVESELKVTDKREKVIVVQYIWSGKAR